MRIHCNGTEAISLKKTLKTVCKSVQCSFKTNIKIKSCTRDVDDLRPGDVFFAIPSSTPSPHSPDCGEEIAELAGLAIHRGCSAVVCDRPVSGADHVPFFIVPNVSECYAAVCQALYDDPAKSLKMIAVAGTSGKTSTSYLISGMLAESGYQVGLIGSLGLFDGVTLHPFNDSDLYPPQLAAWLNRMMINGCTHVVVEVPSRMIAEGHLGGIKFDAVCLTNIRRDHLDYHKTVEQYRRCQLGIFRYAKKHALAVCNADDRISEAVTPLIDQPLLSVGVQNHADVSSLLIERCASEQTFIVRAGTEAVAFQTKIVGDAHLYNCLTATALGIGLEVDVKTIARGIERIAKIPGRMEKLEFGQGFHVFLDSARTLDSLKTALHTVHSVTSGRLICVFGAAAGHEVSHRSKFAKALEKYCDAIILTSVSEQFDPAASSAVCDIRGEITQEHHTRIVPDRAEALALGLSEAEEGDTVLIFGHGSSKDAAFCDRHFTRQWLQEHQFCDSMY